MSFVDMVGRRESTLSQSSTVPIIPMPSTLRAVTKGSYSSFTKFRAYCSKSCLGTYTERRVRVRSRNHLPESADQLSLLWRQGCLDPVAEVA